MEHASKPKMLFIDVYIDAVYFIGNNWGLSNADILENSFNTCVD